MSEHAARCYAAKLRRNQAFIESIHRPSERTRYTTSHIPQRNEPARYDSRPSAPPADEPRELGWSEATEIDASLIFPWLDAGG